MITSNTYKSYYNENLILKKDDLTTHIRNIEGVEIEQCLMISQSPAESTLLCIRYEKSSKLLFFHSLGKIYVPWAK